MDRKSINLLEESIENVRDLGLGKDFWDVTPKAWSLEEVIDTLDFIKIKNFSSFNDTVKRLISKPQIGESIYNSFI